MTADRTHLHDRLLLHGHSHRGVVLIMYAWTTWACVVAVSFLLMPPLIVLAWALPAAVLIVLATLFQFPSAAGSSRRRSRGTGVPGGRVAVGDGQTVISRPNLDHMWSPLSHHKQDPAGSSSQEGAEAKQSRRFRPVHAELVDKEDD